MKITACGTRTTLILALSTVMTGPCFGQDPVPPTSVLPMRLGGLQLAPGISFSNGLDTNVFNAPVRERRDWVWTLRPRTDAVLAFRRARLSGRGAVEVVHFQQYTSERSVNYDAAAGLSVPFGRIQPYVTGTFLRTRERPSFAIDARSEREEGSESVGATVRASSLTSVELAATRTRVNYDKDAVFLGSSLRDELTRTTDTLRLTVRDRLTPLTALVMNIEKTNDTFWYSPARDSSGFRVLPAIEFGSFALISGRVSVGHRRLHLRDMLVPNFNGVVASTELAYTLLGATRIQLQVARDLDYSYEFVAPYYVSARVGGSVSRQVGQSVGVIARGDRYHFGFRGAGPDAGRVETLVTYGGGVFARFGRRLRLEVTADYATRRSPNPFREYNGLRVVQSFVHEL